MQRLKIRSGGHPDESDTDAEDTRDDNASTASGGTGTDTESVVSRRSSVRDGDAGSVRSLGSMQQDGGDMASFVPQKRKERWRRVPLSTDLSHFKPGCAQPFPPPSALVDMGAELHPKRPWMRWVVDKLRPGSVHTFRLRMRNSKGWSDHSYTATETRVLPDVPLRPYDVVVTPLSPFSILVRWKAPHHNGSALARFHLQECRMRYCDDDNDSDSEPECGPSGGDVVQREQRLAALYRGGAMPVRRPENAHGVVDPWIDVPISDWISRRLGETVPKMMHVVSAGDRMVEEDDDDSDLDTPRDTYRMEDDTVDDLDVTVELREDELKQLERSLQSTQLRLQERAEASKHGRRASNAAELVALQSGTMDDDTAAQLKRVEQVVGPRLRRSDGTPMAWLVGNLRPGSWHSFRISAINGVGEGEMCAATAFTRSLGAMRMHAVLCHACRRTAW
jgi:hypothetical protein